jgi:tetratricopeptide (TPR) repeat protein
MLRRLLLLFVCCFLCFASAPFAFAQGGEVPSIEQLDEQQQRELASLIDLAEANAERDDHEKALGYFEDAYALFPHPQLLYKIAISQEKIGKTDIAIQNYREFAKRMPDAAEAPNARRRALVLEEQQRNKRAASLNNDTSLRVFSTPPGAKVFLNTTASRVMGATPTVELPMRPGTHTVILQLEGYKELREEVVIEPGEKVIKKYNLSIDPEATVEDSARAGSSVRAAPLVFLGIGVAGTGTAIFGAVRSRKILETPRDYPESAYDRAQLITYLGAGVAVVGFTGALVTWIAGGSKKRAEAPPGLRLPMPEDARAQGALLPFFSPSGSGMGLEVRF